MMPHMREEIQGFHMNPKNTIVISDFLDQMTLYHLKLFPPRIDEGAC